MSKKPIWSLIVVVSIFALWIWIVAAGIAAGFLASSAAPDISGIEMAPSLLLLGVGLYLAVPLLVFVLIAYYRLTPMARYLEVAPVVITLLVYLVVYIREVLISQGIR